MTDETAVAAAYMGNKTIEALNLPVPELRPGEVGISPGFTGSAAPTCTCCTVRWIRA